MWSLPYAVCELRRQTPAVGQVVASLQHVVCLFQAQHVRHVFLAGDVYAKIPGNAGLIITHLTPPPLTLGRGLAGVGCVVCAGGCVTVGCVHP